VQTNRRTVDEHEKQITNLTYRMLNLEVLNKNRNLVIYGVYESRDDDIYEVVQCFLYDRLCIDIDNIYIEFVEILGPKSRHSHVIQRRPILVTLRYKHEVDSIMRQAKRLAGTTLAIDRDYPSEIRDARKRCWEVLKTHRVSGRANSAQLRFPAAVYVNERCVMDEFPGWKDIINPPISQRRTSRPQTEHSTMTYADAVTKAATDTARPVMAAQSSSTASATQSASTANSTCQPVTSLNTTDSVFTPPQAVPRGRLRSRSQQPRKQRSVSARGLRKTSSQPINAQKASDVAEQSQSSAQDGSAAVKLY